MQTRETIGRTIAAAGIVIVAMGARVNGEMPSDWCGMGTTSSATCATQGVCDNAAMRDGWIPGASTEFLTIRLRFVVFADDNGDFPATDEEHINAQLQQLNDDFFDYKIRFVKGPTAFISSTRFLQFCLEETGPTFQCQHDEDVYDEPDLCVPGCVDDGNGGDWCSEEWELKNAHAESPATQINIFVIGQPNGSGFFGYGRLPWCTDLEPEMGGVMIVGSRIGGTTCDGGGRSCTILTHELGHNLGLWHTHWGAGDLPDCVSNCYEDPACDCSDPACNDVGDFCCDTPPTQRNEFCVELTDPWCGVVYANTDLTNHMGWGGDGCADHFSAQQSGRMHCWLCDAAGGWIDGPDCNANGTADVCDLRSGTSTDCDGNEIPDDCEYPVGGCCTAGVCSIQAEVCCTQQGGTFTGGLDGCDDCNNNGVPDSCDIAADPSLDCYNGNGIPDSCEFVPRGACCLPPGPTECVGYVTECWCTAQGGGGWSAGKKCFQVNCLLFGPQQP